MISNIQELQSQARELALTHELSHARPETRAFWATFRADMQSLRSFAGQLAQQRAECVQPAEDWLLDHMAFLEAHAQAVIRKLPRSILHQLPKLQDTGVPRIYAVCNDYLSHVDGRYSPLSFESYLRAYQEVSVLKLIECWQLPAAMSVVLVRRLAKAMSEVRYRHGVCRFTASLFDEIGGKSMSDDAVRKILAKETRRREFSVVEVVHLVRHLGEKEPDTGVLREWLAAYVENSESSLEQMISLEHQLQAKLQVTCGNLVQSLHALERDPWQDTFQRISHIHEILSADTGGQYPLMDFSSQDLLRTRVADVAGKMRVPETLVAQSSVELAQGVRNGELSAGRPQPRQAFPEYYLLEPEGVALLRGHLEKAARPRRLPKLLVLRHPWRAYWLTGTILFLVLLWITQWVVMQGYHPAMWWVAVLVALFWPVSEWTVRLLHAGVGKFCTPHTLLRYDFSKRIPDKARTMVVMPIIWSSVDEVDEAVNQLLVHAYANRQENIHFAILADFRDASAQEEAEDAAILNHAVNQIRQLQKKHGDRFFLFHRSRCYNESDGIYMGWERKRGKLVEFVELLSGKQGTSFTTLCGNLEILPKIRYVFTVDFDTILPIGVVGRMAGTIHLPFNRPRFNEEQTLVAEGYGVLQPQLGVSWESTQKSRFAALWAGEPGIDPYAFAVSNPYQDLFGQGIFVGKGIFDVEAFRKTLVQRIPENRVLSHDILEGGFLRAGLTSDIEVVEEYPSTFYAHQRRAHRWIRGDWQLLPWLGRKCKDRQGALRRNDLQGLTRWQVIDNLRRSLMEPALLLIILFGAWILPGRTWAWEGTVLLTLFQSFFRELVKGVTGRGNLHALSVSFLQSFVRLLTLPFSAVLAMDAIFRSLYRVYVSRRKLLEWVTSARTNRKSKSDPLFLRESVSYGFIALFPVLTWLSGETVDKGVGIFGFVMWLCAPLVIAWLNRSSAAPAVWKDSEKEELTQTAREIWSFYERYVTAGDSWLPPDNVQYYPTETIAHRTSPTNIGLYLACVVAAADLNFIDEETMLLRIENCLQTLMRMEKWEGHLFNWYDTRSLSPLPPFYVSTVDSGNLAAYLMVVRQSLLERSLQSERDRGRLLQLAQEIDGFVENIRFSSLYNPTHRLFHLGYNLEERRKESVLYDLLASESRQCSFVAIALGQVPASHWFTLGRTMTLHGKRKVLLSWSGTIFEYLMPSLIMRTYPKTLWDITYRGVVRRQQIYANEYKVPFGISESGYYAFDYALNYQYRAFGVPGLGFDRGLEQNLVVAPYATILSLPISGKAGLTALRQFRKLGAKGAYGYFEAVDFTAKRLPAGHKYKVIQSFMAHHQGMSLLTLTNLLRKDIMIERFHADARVQAAKLLLQERVPQKAALITDLPKSDAEPPEFESAQEDAKRVYTHLPQEPEVNVLSNGSMTSATAYGATGFLAWRGLAVTRWSEDPVAASGGPAVYVRNLASDQSWNLPGGAGDSTKTVFQLDKTLYEGTRGDLSFRMEITVCSDCDAEIRRLRLRNNSADERWLEVTSFFELSLAPKAADRAHPAFSKLFVETTENADLQCLLARRRPRGGEEKEVWAAHGMYVAEEAAGAYEFETNRAAFIGRGYTLESPKGLFSRLRGSVGSVADPAFIMRRVIHVKPQSSATVYLVTGVGENRSQVTEAIQRLRDTSQIDSAFHLSWVRSQIDLAHLHLSPQEAAAAQRLAGKALYAASLSAARSQAIRKNVLGQSALWPHGIGGDNPIVSVRFGNPADLPYLMVFIRQHQYLRAKGLDVHLVILDETDGNTEDGLMQQIRGALAARGIAPPSGLTALKIAQLSLPERQLLIAVSRVTLRAGGPSLVAQLQLAEQDFYEGSTAAPESLYLPEPEAVSGKKDEIPLRGTPPQTETAAEFWNGWGGFVEDGQAYEIQVQPGEFLPKPWINVIANPSFGCTVSELGTGYTWWRNAHQCKLTPWRNDPVLDLPGECVFIRDFDGGDPWSASAKPAGGQRNYKVTHRWGSSSIEQTSGEVKHRMDILVPLEDPVKLVRLKIFNESSQTKRLSVTYYAEWVLGVNREAQAPFVVSQWDGASRALLARNTYQEDFREALAFLHVAAPEASGKGVKECSFTADKTGFIGYGGDISCPKALLEERLDGRAGAIANSCGALQTVVEVPAQGSQSVIFLLGCAGSEPEVKTLVERYGSDPAFEQAAAQVQRFWNKVTGSVQVKTPDRSMDIMLNGWLLYQALCCRIWARTAFYQAGGAFGFRDQLQDSLALLHTASSLTRAQILRHAGHQYQEGDVQHWWHEETGKGIRTRYSDDLLWLPYTVLRYLQQTEDFGLLYEKTPFLHSEPLKQDEMERYEDTVLSGETGTVLDHCLRAVACASRFGEHGIPLMGGGDWNDGMNLVGNRGRGESVWLGWFLLDILKRMIQLGDRILSSDTIREFREKARQLEENLNEHAWDGAWFRRAFTDGGNWLGSIANRECRIDAIAQSWSVIAQGTTLEKQRRAMASFDRELVDRELQLARLLTEPFNATLPSPGYIQGYPPGIRENGGQYTHGVIWSIVAWALLGDGDKAFELFSMFNPVLHTETSREVRSYGNEPYVVSADVYTAHPLEGSAGWSWYTGAAGWMYQAGLEYILGVRRRGNRLYIQPAVPRHWKEYSITYKFGGSTYEITVTNDETLVDGPEWTRDGEDLGIQPYLELEDSGDAEKIHQVQVRVAFSSPSYAESL